MKGCVLIVVVVFLCIVIAAIFLVDEKINKNKLNEEKKEREAAEKRNEEIQKKKLQELEAKARDLLTSDTFLKLFNAVNKANLKYSESGESKGVYECYPYSSFTIYENRISGSYFILNIKGGFNTDVKFINLNYSEINVPVINKEDTEIIAMAFSLSKGYQYAGGSSVKIDKTYWNAPNSINDIENKFS